MQLLQLVVLPIGLILAALSIVANFAYWMRVRHDYQRLSHYIVLVGGILITFALIGFTVGICITLASH